jgi:L-threonylcarbamoyladenylate synthase
MIGTDINTAKKWLDTGNVIAFPTETVYGLGANAFDTMAVAKIYQIKNRPHFDPLIVHLPNLDMLARVSTFLPVAAAKLLAAFSPGPLTVILPKSPEIPDLVTGGLETIAIRIPSHPLALELLSVLDYPLAAPSANPFGYISPTTARHVEEQLGGRIPYILDGGPCSIGIESTIVAFPDGKPTIFRQGGIALEEIENLVGQVNVVDSAQTIPHAPGMLEKHYSPKTPILVGDVEELLLKHEDQKVALLLFYDKDLPAQHKFVLSPHGDLCEATRQFFAFMREIDKLGVDLILAEWLPERGLGRALNDRLRRAAAQVYHQ